MGKSLVSCFFETQCILVSVAIGSVRNGRGYRFLVIGATLRYISYAVISQHCANRNLIVKQHDIDKHHAFVHSKISCKASNLKKNSVVTFYRAMLCHGRVSVRPSVTSRSSTKTAERIELVFGMWASFHPSYSVLKGNSVIFKNKDTSLWNFVLNSGLRKFRDGISIVETCYQLCSRKVDAPSVINWAVVGQLSR